jgi:acyl carrier protein
MSGNRPWGTMVPGDGDRVRTGLRRSDDRTHPPTIGRNADCVMSGGAVDPDRARALVVSLLDDIAPDGDAGGLDPEQDIRGILDLDSLDFLSFVADIEQRTGLRVPESDYARLRTVGDCTAYLTAALSAS